MKNTNIKEMNATERLEFAHQNTKILGELLLQDILNDYKYCFKEDSKRFKLWVRVELNMFKMRGITLISRYNLLM